MLPLSLQVVREMHPDGSQRIQSRGPQRVRRCSDDTVSEHGEGAQLAPDSAVCLRGKCCEHGIARRRRTVRDPVKPPGEKPVSIVPGIAWMPGSTRRDRQSEAYAEQENDASHVWVASVMADHCTYEIR